MPEIILINSANDISRYNFVNVLKEELESQQMLTQILYINEPMNDVLSELFEMSTSELEKSDNGVLFNIFHSAMSKWFGEDIWIRALKDRIQPETDYVIVPDFQFDHEILEDAVLVKLNKGTMKAVFDYEINTKETESAVKQIVEDLTMSIELEQYFQELP